MRISGLRISGLIAGVVFLLFANDAALAAEPLLRAGDRVALVGGTFVERLQQCGALEAELQCRRPDLQLSVRNLGWSGDNVLSIARKGFDGPDDGIKRLLADLDSANPTVVLLAYGFSEASREEVKSGQFETGYRQLIGTLAAKSFQRPIRMVLVKPLAMPGYRTPGYADTIAACREIVDKIASESGLPTIDAPWNDVQWSDDQWTGAESLLEPNRLLPSPDGYAELARGYADALVGGKPCGQIDPALTTEIVEKNQLFFHRHRPQNETYLFLFRKHEQGRNAAEIPMFDPLIEAADKAIWAAAK